MIGVYRSSDTLHGLGESQCCHSRCDQSGKQFHDAVQEAAATLSFRTYIDRRTGGLRLQVLFALPDIIPEALIIIIVPEIVQELPFQLLLAVIRKRRISDGAMCDQRIIPVIQGKEQQHAVPVSAVADIQAVVNGRCSIICTGAAVFAVVIQNDHVDAALILLRSRIGNGIQFFGLVFRKQTGDIPHLPFICICRRYGENACRQQCDQYCRQNDQSALTEIHRSFHLCPPPIRK